MKLTDNKNIKQTNSFPIRFGGSLHKNNTNYLLLGLYHHASVNELCCGIGKNRELASIVRPPSFVHYTVVASSSRNVANSLLDFLKWVHTVKDFQERTHLLD